MQSRRPSPSQFDAALPYGGLRTPDGISGGSSSGGSTPTATRAASQPGTTSGSGAGSGFSTRRGSNLGVVPEGESLPGVSPRTPGSADEQSAPVLSDTTGSGAGSDAIPGAAPEEVSASGESPVAPGDSHDQTQSASSAVETAHDVAPSDVSVKHESIADDSISPESPQAGSGQVEGEQQANDVLANGDAPPADDVVGDSVSGEGMSGGSGGGEQRGDLPRLRLGPGEEGTQLASPGDALVMLVTVSEVPCQPNRTIRMLCSRSSYVASAYVTQARPKPGCSRGFLSVGISRWS